jgi:hypothetical protein
MKNFLSPLFLTILFTIAWTATTAFGDTNEELAKKTQNPVADLISLPFQDNLEFGFGPHNRTKNILNIQMGKSFLKECTGTMVLTLLFLIGTGTFFHAHAADNSLVEPVMKILTDEIKVSMTKYPNKKPGKEIHGDKKSGFQPLAHM